MAHLTSERRNWENQFSILSDENQRECWMKIQ
jgi:hypothetical protein